jgi:predicted O-methyltransferase YrrM
MAYHGYVPTLQQFLSSRDEPKVLEVGIDLGTTCIPLVVSMAENTSTFLYLGIDVAVREHVSITVANLGDAVRHNTKLVQDNSLNVLPMLVAEKMKFDVVLLDGDHNYYTVSQELNYIQHLVKDDGIILIDDYNGKWAERDLWYAARDGYQDNKLVTQPIETEKHGVAIAVNEWLAQHPELEGSSPIKGEPILIRRK